jgi:hypothetical protein
MPFVRKSTHQGLLGPLYQILICLRKLLITNGSAVKRLQRRLAWKPVPVFSGSMRAEKRLLFFNFVVRALVCYKSIQNIYTKIRMF